MFDHLALARIEMRRAAGILPRRGNPREAERSVFDAGSAALVLATKGTAVDRAKVLGEGLLTAAAERYVREDEEYERFDGMS